MTFPKRKLVYIAHQIAGDREKNLRSAKLWVRWAVLERNVVPIAPYLTLIGPLDDDSEEERKIGREIGYQMVDFAEELWICGPKPPEDSFVWDEVARAGVLEIPVVNYTCLIMNCHFSVEP